MAMLTLSQLKTALAITDSTKDGQYQWLIDSATQAIKTYCKRNFESATYTEFYTGQDTPKLLLRQYPVTAVANVWENYAGFYGQNPDSSFDAATLLVVGKDYVWSKEGSSTGANGILVRLGQPWPMLNFGREARRLSNVQQASHGNIRVEYTAGYTTIPQDLQHAIVMTVSYWRLMLRFGTALKREKLGRWEYELQQLPLSKGLPDDVKELLSVYREEVI